MALDLIDYIREFWSPEKVLLAFLTFFSWVAGKYSTVYYTHCNYAPEQLHRVSCDLSFIDSYIRPWSVSSDSLMLFFLVLLLLPLPLLRRWFLYIGTWSIPLGLLLFLTSSPPGPGQIIGTPNVSPAAMLELAVTLWIALLIGFILFIAGKRLWRRQKQQ